VHYAFKLAELLPPADPMTVPFVRLMMAVDDMRRAQDHLLEATVRLERVPDFEKYLPLGDHLYAIRRLYSHLHEAGRALRALDTAAKKRVDSLLASKPDVSKILRTLRVFFNAEDYDASFVSRMRNAIGFHYNPSEVSALVRKYFMEDALGQAVAAEVGALGRMADVLVLRVLDDLACGDLLTGGGTVERVVREATGVMVNLITFVDQLFDSLLAQTPDAGAEYHEGVVEIPVYLRRANWIDAGRTSDKEKRGDGQTR
jgi:hypothetical protein